MNDGVESKNSLLAEITAGMEISPIETAGEKVPDRTVLFDGYQRSSEEQAMFVTDKYRHRYIRLLLYGLLALIVLVLLLMMVFQ